MPPMAIELDPAGRSIRSVQLRPGAGDILRIQRNGNLLILSPLLNGFPSVGEWRPDGKRLTAMPPRPYPWAKGSGYALVSLCGANHFHLSVWVLMTTTPITPTPIHPLARS